MAYQASQAWTFGKGTRDALSQGKRPGPGQYTVGVKSAGPSFAMSKGGRDGPGGKDKRPGPGQYGVGSSFGTQGKTMGGKNANGGFLGPQKKTPGPGQYAVSGMRPKTAGGAFGGKYGSSLAINPQTTARVGPGAYNMGMAGSSKNVKKNLGFGTDQSGRGVGVNNNAPGPGMYNTRGNMDIENGHIFGTSTRADAKDLMRTPGPGQYSQAGSIRDGGASIKGKSSVGGFIQIRDTPGPGNYNIDARKSQGCKIGTGQRSDFVGGKDVTPGPGHHNASDWDVRSKQGKGSKFGPHSTGVTQDRSKGLVSNPHNPGPAHYSYGSSKAGPAYSMGAKINDKDNNWQPAPGTYNHSIDAIKGDAKASRFGGGNRSDIASGKHGPGPGQYNASNFRPTDSISYSIGDSKRKNVKNSGNPGPGQYHVPYYVSDVPRYQMPNKPDEWRFV